MDYPQQALNRALREFVDFIHAEGWDAPPTLCALVPAELIEQSLGDLGDDAPLAVVPQQLPEHLLPGSDELGDYLSRVEWPEQVVGCALAQEIQFVDPSSDDPAPRPARLFSGVLRGGLEQTFIQLRPSEEELAAAGPFAEDEVELLGGASIGPGVLAVLHRSFE